MRTDPASRSSQPAPCSTETAGHEPGAPHTGAPGFRSTGPVGWSVHAAGIPLGRRELLAPPRPAGTARATAGSYVSVYTLFLLYRERPVLTGIWRGPYTPSPGSRQQQTGGATRRTASKKSSHIFRRGTPMIEKIRK